MLTGNEIETLLEEHKRLKEEQRKVMNKILEHISSWQSLADLGFTVEAIKRYRETHCTTLGEAHEVVTSFQALMRG